MDTIHLIKSRKPCNLYNVISWLFILCGGKIYLDYILITNPTSRNPLIKKLWGWMKDEYTAKRDNTRYINSYIWGGIHVVLLTVNIIAGSMWSIGNILANVYPIIVQLYIGYRCYRIKAGL